jgi:phospholipid/cholesterol/gamma-HCH transport system substrate-binding protein
VAFACVVLVGTAVGIGWYFVGSSRYTNFQLRTRNSADGLIADAPVEFHGVEVGKVKRVELIDPHSVSILLSVRKDAPVTRATVATITARGLATRGFTGYVYIALEDVGTDSQPLQPPPGSAVPVIPVAPSRIVSLDMTIDQVMQDVQLLTHLVQSVLDQKTVGSLKQSLDDLQKVTQTLAANDEKLRSLISNAEMASNQLKPLLESSSDAVKALQTQLLPQTYDTLLKLDKVSASLKDVAAEIERDPSVLVRGKSPPPPGPGEKK